MAWIAMRTDLLDDPAVIAIAHATGVDEYGVVGRLLRLWSWADQHTEDGNAPHVTTAWVDRFTGTAGFSAAMLDAGWLRVRSAGLEFPNFTRWNTNSAKKRLSTAKRVSTHKTAKKKGNAPGNAKGNAVSVTTALPTEQNRTEQVIPPNPPQAGGESGGAAKRKPRPSSPADPPGFAEFWSAYPRKTARANAVKAFAALSPDADILAAILAALAAQRTWDGWTKDGGKYIPHPATWLNAERWKDEPPAVLAPKPAATKPTIVYDPIPPMPTGKSAPLPWHLKPRADDGEPKKEADVEPAEW